MLEPWTRVSATEMTNEFFEIVVWPHTFGQFRIQLYWATEPNTIAREMWTTKRPTMEKVIECLKNAEEPDLTCEKWAVYPDDNEEFDLDRHNCVAKREHIRLDHPTQKPMFIPSFDRDFSRS